jgi:hypothetical protein
MAPTTWASECSRHVQWAQELIDMIHLAITAEDWTLMDCQKYLVDWEMSLAGVATALEVSGPGQLRDDQMGIYRELEPQVVAAHGLAKKLRTKHLKTYDLLGIPLAAASPSDVSDSLKASRQKLNTALLAGRRERQSEPRAGSSRQNLRAAEDPRSPSAARRAPPEEAWPWFSGQLDGLLWFKRA